MLTPEEHIDNLVRHIRLVQEATILLGERLIATGRKDFGRKVIACGFVHDASKWHGIEWDFLHAGPDTPKEKLEDAIRQHVQTNEHHPEAWGGINEMSELAVAEMCCDWYARAQEFGTGLREWIETTAKEKYGIAEDSQAKRRIDHFVGLLLQDYFVKKDGQ